MKKIINHKILHQDPRANRYSYINSSIKNINYQTYSKPFTPDFYNSNENVQTNYHVVNNQYKPIPKKSSIVKRHKTPNFTNSIGINTNYQIYLPTKTNNSNVNLLSYENNKIIDSQNHINNYNSIQNIYLNSYETGQSQEILSNGGNINSYIQEDNYVRKGSFGFNNIFSEPGEKLTLSQFELNEEIGKGTYGEIYRTKWKVNNKYYALKREKLKDINGVKKRDSIFKIIRDFLKKTNCKGVINIYSNLYFQKGVDFRYYELMEMCDKDFEQEIKTRSKYYLFYTENELRNIMFQLITALACLQKNHITHRDIKPQNILIVNGQYKLCDFGEIRVMQREGIVVQRVRGSELYMSPILFYGLQDDKYQVRHNTYKSDVFSLGMCLFFAAGLSFDGPVEIREELNMNKIKEILNKTLSSRYSQKLINILHLMLQIEEKNRPDFILLEDAIKKYGL